MHDAQIKIEKIRKPLNDFLRQQNEGAIRAKDLHSWRNEIGEVRNDLRWRYKSISHLKETDDFDDSD